MVKFFNDISPHEKRITLSTALTLLRIALVPFFVGAMIVGCFVLASALFIAAAITDVLDGYLARQRNEQTYLGACLDPIADKLLMLSCFGTFALVQTPFFSIPRWLFFALLIKEIIIIVGAYGIYHMRGTVTIAPTFLGKMATMMQVLFIVWLFISYFFCWMSISVYYLMLAAVFSSTALSFVHYSIIGIRQLMDKKGF